VAFGRVNGLARELSFHRFAQPGETKGLALFRRGRTGFLKSIHFPRTPFISAAPEKKLRGWEKIFLGFSQESLPSPKERGHTRAAFARVRPKIFSVRTRLELAYTVARRFQHTIN
jgi:hypothetical protein